MDNKIRNKIDSNKPLERVVKIQLSKKELRYFQNLSEEEKAQFIKNIEENNSISDLGFFGLSFLSLLNTIKVFSGWGTVVYPLRLTLSAIYAELATEMKVKNIRKHLLNDHIKRKIATAMTLLSLANAGGSVSSYMTQNVQNCTFKEILKLTAMTVEDLAELPSYWYRQKYGAYVVDRLFQANTTVPVKVSNEAVAEKSKENNFPFELYYKSIESNSFIDEELKSAIESQDLIGVYQFIRDNPYIDKKIACQKLVSIQMDAVKEIDKDNPDIGANYSQRTHRAKIKTVTDGNIFHEIEHSLGCLPNSVLNEGMASKIIEEYCFSDTRTNAYQYTQIPFTCIFCELLGADLMLQAYTERSMDLIDQKMIECGLSQNEVQRLYQIMNQTCDIKNNDNSNAQEQLDSLKSEFKSLFMKLLESPIIRSQLEEQSIDFIVYYMYTAFTAERITPPSKLYFNKSLATESYYQETDKLEQQLTEWKRR